jgi:single-strand DNA-binding protein
MNDLNQILLSGNLTGTPRISRTPKGTPVCRFSIGVNSSYKDGLEAKKEVSFIDITTWSRLADACNMYLKKGRAVRITGALKQDRWQDAEGKNHSKIHVLAQRVEFVPEKKNAAPEEAFADSEQPPADLEPNTEE